MNNLKKFAIVALAVLGITITSISPGSAAAFVKFDGVDGEALDTSADPARGIDLGEPTTRLQSRARDGDNPGELTFRREMDGASPLLRRWAASNRSFGSLTIYVPRRRGQSYLRYELTNVRVTSYSVSGDADDRPTEEVAFYYSKIALVTEPNEVDPPSRSRRY